MNSSTVVAATPTLFLAAGIALVVLAVIWRSIALGGANRRIRVALADPDPVRRAAGVDVATTHGLTRYAGALLSLVQHESEPHVLDAVRDAVKRHVWEPADNRRVVDLRLWADGWGKDDADLAPPRPDHVSLGDNESVRTVRVLVTGAGGPAGVGVIRALAAAGHVVTAVDTDPLAPGLALAASSDVVPPADAPAFVDSLVEVVGRLDIEAVIPTLTEEMLALSERREDVAPAMWLPPTRALETCCDKWLFARAMHEAGIRTPATSLDSPDGIPGPWVVKPRRARGSRGVTFVDRAEDLAAALHSVDDPIVQSRVHGDEFTVDALVSRDGELVGAVPRWRIETKAGISTKGRTFADDRVIEGVAVVLSAFHFQGVANVQGFVDGDDVCFLEVNPRFSGGLPLSLAAGADLVGEYLRGVLGLSIRCERLAYREGTTMTRYFEEIYA